MPVTTFKQYVFPQTPANIDGVSGVIDFRISRGLYPWNWIDTTPADVFTIDKAYSVNSESTNLIETWSPIKMKLADQDGDMSIDVRTITLRDAWQYSGKDGTGTAYAEDLGATQQSLLWKILQSDTTVQVYQCWWTFMPTPKNGAYNAGTAYTIGQTVSYLGRPYKALGATTGNLPTNVTYWAPNWDIYWGGDLDQTQIATLPILTVKSRTSSSMELDTFTLSIKSFADRMKNGTVGMLTGQYSPLFTNPPNTSGVPTSVPFAQSDMVSWAAGGITGLTTRPFYIGFTGNDSNSFTGLDDYQIYNNTASTYVAGYGRFEDYNDSHFTAGDAWPQRPWGVKPSRCIAKGANLLGMDFNESTDFVPAFTFYEQAWNDTHKSYDLFSFTAANLAVCYNTLFGINFTNTGATFVDNPIAFKPDTTIAEYFKAWAYQFGCYVFFQLNQLTGRPNVRLLSRRTSGGTVPAFWTMTIGHPKQEPTIIAKDFVGIKNKGADGEWRVPFNPTSTNGISIEIPLRTRAFGSIGATNTVTAGQRNIWPLGNLILNDKGGFNGQSVYMHMSDDGQTPPVSQEGSIVGAHLFYIETTTGTNKVYPPLYAARALWADGASGPWDGFYAAAGCSERTMPTGTTGAGPNTLAGSRMDSMNAPGQLLARELLGNKQVYTVKYKGCSDGAGKISAIKLNIEDSWAPLGGVNTTFRGLEIEIDELKSTTTIKHVQKPDYSALTDLPAGLVLANSGSNTSPSSMVGGNISGGNAAANAGPFLLQQPSTAPLNTLTPTTDVVALTHKPVVAYTSDQEQWQTSGGVTVTKVKADGSLSSTANITMSNTPVAGTDVVNVTYYNAHLPAVPTDTLLNDPATTARNNITPTSDSAVALTLNPHSGTATANVFESYDSSGVARVTINKNGTVTLTKSSTITDTTSGFILSLTNNGTGASSGGVLDIESASTLADNKNLIYCHNTGTNARGQFNFSSDGSLIIGPQDNSASLASAFGFSGGESWAFHTFTSGTYTLTGLHRYIDANTTSGNITLNLPNPTTCKGTIYSVRKTSASNTVTVSTATGYINNATTKAWTALYQAYTFVSNGTNWGIF